MGIPFNINGLVNVICLSLCGEPTAMDSLLRVQCQTIQFNPFGDQDLVSIVGGIIQGSIIGKHVDSGVRNAARKVVNAN